MRWKVEPRGTDLNSFNDGAKKKNYPENLLKLKTVVLLNVMRLFVSDECFIHFFTFLV